MSIRGSATVPTGTVTVALTNDMVAHGVSALRAGLYEAVESGATRIRVDVAAVQDVRTDVLAALVGVQHECNRRGGGLTLVNPDSALSRLLVQTGLWRVLRTERAPLSPA